MVISVNNKFWTQRGLDNLGKILKQSRENRNLSLRDAADVISRKLSSCYVTAVDHGTISRIEKGHGEPKWNTLVAISASQFVRDKYNNPLTIYDFIDIASESTAQKLEKSCNSSKLGVSEAIADMCINIKIAIAMRVYNISQQELEAKFLNRKSPQTLTVERLREIQLTGEAAVGEKRVIYIVLDDREQVFSRDQWLGNCDAAIERMDDVICNGIS